MERKFRAQVGLSPKVYARIERFESALRIKAATPERSWTFIAHELGYYDQIHMVHDFLDLSGENPRATLVRALDGLSLDPPVWFAYSGNRLTRFATLSIRMYEDEQQDVN